MKKKLVVVMIAVALVCLASVAAIAEEEQYSGNGTIVSYSGDRIVFSTNGESITLTINEDTEISGDIKAGVVAYVEWRGNIALYIELEESSMGEDE